MDTAYKTTLELDKVLNRAVQILDQELDILKFLNPISANNIYIQCP